MPFITQAGSQGNNQGVNADELARNIQDAVDQALAGALQAQDAGTEVTASARDQLRAAIDQMRAEVDQARLQGRSVVVQPPFAPDIIPPQAVDISIAFFVTMAFIIVGLPLARAFARRMDRRGQAAPAAEMTPRLERIEQAVDAIAIEVERISENQRYSTRVISELRGLPAPNPVGGWQSARESEPVPREATEPLRP